MGSEQWLQPAPSYHPLETYWDTEDDAPGPRCAHTLTAVAQTETQGPRLILFGGATTIVGGAASAIPEIRLAGLTNSVHSYDVLTRKWTRIRPTGEPPSPRAAHAAAAVGPMVVIQGGIGPEGHSTDDLYVLDMDNDIYNWHRVVVQGQGPGPRYGHVMDLVAQRYLVTVGGNDGKRVVSDAWALDTTQKPYAWQKLNPGGDKPSARMYATASVRSDGLFLLFGGRDTSCRPLADAYGLFMHSNGRWEWTLLPGVAPSSRYQHATVFVGARLHVTGGVVKGGQAVDGEAAVAVFDTADGVWLDRHGLVTAQRSAKGPNDPSLELMRRCRHAASSFGVRLYIYGGVRGKELLGDFLVAENLPFQSDVNTPVLTSGRGSNMTSPRGTNSLSPFDPISTDNRSESPSGASSMDKESMDMLVEASAAEAEAANAVWLAAQAQAANPEDTSVQNDMSYSAKKFTRQKSPQHLHKKFQHLKIELEAIKSATNKFDDAHCIGKGGFGKVYKGELLHSKGQSVVALKRLDRAFGQGNPEFWKEIVMLSLYKHDNIVSLLGFCDDCGEMIRVYEYAPKKSLDLYLNDKDLTWVQRLEICIGAARGLAYLHNPGQSQQRVLHRDIKSSNILLDENWNARIADFGLSKFGPANQLYTFLVSNAVGTIGYIDPLYAETGLLTKESDIYSFGVVLFEILCGRLCISNNRDERQPLIGLVRKCYKQKTVDDIIFGNIKNEINPHSLKAFTTIAYQCLKREREQRPLMTKVVTVLESALQLQVSNVPPPPSLSPAESSASPNESPLIL